MNCAMALCANEKGLGLTEAFEDGTRSAGDAIRIAGEPSSKAFTVSI